MTAKAIENLHVEFGQVSVGEDTAAVLVKIQRNDLTLSVAEKTLCKRRMDVELFMAPKNEDPDQKHFDGMKPKVKGTCDTSRLSVGLENLTTRLTFNKKEISISELANLAKRVGRVKVFSTEKIPISEENQEEEE